ncbi:MAG: universal stress protein [Deltaproteobacteria bacterium]|nr:universal stress protein [Deltaproteobacteria bacterium]
MADDEWKEETFDDEGTATRERARPIVVALDFSAVARHALAWAIDQALRTGSELHTVHVVDRRLHKGDLSADPTALKTELAQVHAEAGAELARQLDDEHRAKLGHVIEHIRVGSPAEEILAVATEVVASAIVVGSHGHGALERALLGSTAERVVRRATCPVVVIKH